MANILVNDENISACPLSKSAKMVVTKENGNSKQSSKKSVLSKIDNLMHHKTKVTPLKVKTNLSLIKMQEHQPLNHIAARSTSNAQESVNLNIHEIFLFDYLDHPECLKNCTTRIADVWADNHILSKDLFGQLLNESHTSSEIDQDIFSIPMDYSFDWHMPETPDL